MDRKLDAARLHLRLKEDDIYLTAPSLEARELWKGYIFSIVKLEVPTSLNLLPGQIHMLKEALEQETERRKELAKKSAVAQASVSVPMTEPDDYLTLRSEMPAPVFRHYRVTRIPDGSYAIAIDNPIICPTLHHVTDYLIEKTGGVFKPLVLEHTYEKNIVFVEDNQENGERTLRTTSDSPVAPKVSPIPGGALLPPNERPRSATMTDGTRPKRPAPKMPVQENVPTKSAPVFAQTLSEVKLMRVFEQIPVQILWERF
ncbi:signal transducing adaptor family member 2 [Silurus asotus]|uniref:Signal transducing adaptor family member 2 n=1 Tax=Silurus asotus TaxID=30991 RepID=A0AAD5FBC9_SILAS|nr:signal transducing adaptor family member 2 [Silurus asotus]